jgi:CHC2-type zinc finger protein
MAKGQEWVDFKAVKVAVTIQMVLHHYGIVALSKSGDELRGPCPIHKGSQRSKNFTVNIRKNAFKCFSRDCGSRGNVPDFVAAMEHCQVVDAAIKLSRSFKVGESTSSLELKDDSEQAREIVHGIYKDTEGSLFEVIANPRSAEDFKRMVVYRELFGNYLVWVAPRQDFEDDKSFFSW